MSDFDIGKQASLTIVADGAILLSTQITAFDSKMETKTLESRPLGSPTIRKHIPDGWSFSYDIDRLGPTFDNFFADQEDSYWNDGGEPSIFITETIREKDGSVSQYRYEGVCQTFDSGSKKQDDTVKQKVSGYAERRRKVA